MKTLTQLLVVFLALQLTGVVHWSWWFVLFGPFWIVALAVLIVTPLLLMGHGIKALAEAHA